MKTYRPESRHWRGIRTGSSGLLVVCLVAAVSQSAGAQIRLNLSGGQSGIAVSPGGSGVIGQFNRAGDFQGVAVGNPSNIRVLPNRSQGGVGIVVTDPPHGTPPVHVRPTDPECPPTVVVPGRPGLRGNPHVEVGPDHVRVDVNSDAAAELTRIQSLMRARQLDTALVEASQLVDRYRADAEVLHTYSLIRFARGEFDDAAASHYDALSLGTEWSWNDVRRCFSSHDAYLQPLAKLQNTVTESPESPAINFLLSSHYLMLGATKHARQSLQQTSELMPDDAVVAELRNRLPPAPAIQ